MLLDRLSTEIRNALHRPMRMAVKVDPALIGGIALQIDGIRIDNTIRGRLERGLRFIKGSLSWHLT
ncbi:MAG: F0F1 ATP synthase subunit delta [Sedimentisphaerales bacterium]|nr:F0F1 ATP synthase subunit delta [Sedimentisphaerales bacterium]